jgi:hypothetical protein
METAYTAPRRSRRSRGREPSLGLDAAAAAVVPSMIVIFGEPGENLADADRGQH